MHPAPSTPDAPHPDAPPAHTPQGYTIHAQPTWDLAREDYLAGDSGTQVCERYGLNPSTFADRARREGWRKCDQPDPPPVPDDDPGADEPVDCAALAEDALIQVRRALRKGRAGEAASWMRLHEKLVARVEAEAARERRLRRTARARGADGAGDPLTAALQPLRERMAFINSLGAAQLRVSRAWRQGQISEGCFERFNGLHNGAVDAYDHLIAAAEAHPDGSHRSHPEFSAAPDP